MMAAVHVRVCVDCHEEYRPEIARCADCGGVLQDRYDDDEGQETASTFTPPRVEPGQPEEDGHAIATSDHARQLVPLADRLLEAGLEFRIVPRGMGREEPPRGFELRVADADRSAAIRAVAQVAGPDTGVTLLVAWTPPAADDEDTAVAVPRVRHAGGAVSDGVCRVRARPRGRARRLETRQRRGTQQERREERQREK